MIPQDAATRRQVQAADPGFSTWLAANAGSGKTRVLTDRVARLLLGGVAPLHILCLTYTKAAASEMQNRLFKRLGAWAMLEEQELRAALHELGTPAPVSDEALARARRLFARAIETPGGLKIQTIHSFCASLLRRFPLEAGVSQQFREMDDRAAKILRAEIVDELAQGPHQDVIDLVARHYTGEDFDNLTAAIARFRDRFADDPDEGALRARFGLPKGLEAHALPSRVFLGDEPALFQALLPALRAGSVNDVKAADALAPVDPAAPLPRDLEVLEKVFLTGKGAKEPFVAKIGAFPTKNTRKALAAVSEPLNALMARTEATRALRLGLLAFEKTLALHRFAHVFLPAYEARKRRIGALDFDDLILLAGRLLTDSRMAQWVLFRLDGGIDHILVDEAQDTSPAQWNVIKSLALEFASGQGARQNTPRSLFVVGDKKQSIYSFQGADPDEFDRMRGFFSARIPERFQDLLLEYSFRSAEPILRLVDLTFGPEAPADLGGEISHRAFKGAMPGRVDLWPIEPESREKEDRAWHDPVDKVARNHHAVRLADHIAEQVRGMLDHGAIPQEIGQSGQYRMRRVRAGDILILVQGRQELFHQIIRACKSRDLPIAGADVLRLGAELAVKDITALLAVLATPEDDLSLAAALRSPLFGWSEQQLFDLAHRRAPHSYLFQALRQRKSEFPETFETLAALRDAADYLRPYELLERILTRHNGRHNLLARLGHEAEDGLDALLAQALAYEQSQVPSLTGFLVWLGSGEVVIKRRVDSAEDRIRVMTVHGAKGLEAPIVILPDTMSDKKPLRDELLPAEGGAVLWKTVRDLSPPVVATARARLEAAQERERLRLLYVAMTRAEKWLIVCGAGAVPAKAGSWYQIIENGMRLAGAVAHEFAAGPGLRLDNGQWAPAEETAPAGAGETGSELPVWACQQAKTPPRPTPTLSPSDLGGAKIVAAGPGIRDGAQDEEAALRHGRQIHRLLEHLPACPAGDWPERTAALLATGEDKATAQEASALLKEVRAVLCAPDLRALFAPSALAEVDVSASLPALNGARIHGTIDRLLVDDTRVLAVDFKTNAVVPQTPGAVPEGLMRQMGAYGAALAQIYPGRRIELAILWTRTAQLMPLAHESVTAALRAFAKP